MGRPVLTLAELIRWQENGATWRVQIAGSDQVLVELCTCYGEPVDVMAAAPDLADGIRKGAVTPSSEE